MALVFEGQRYTYGELGERINRLSNALLGLGLGKGERVAVLAHNCSQYIEIYGATAKAGLVIAPLNWRFVERELLETLDHVEASVMVVGKDLVSHIRSIRPRLGSVKTFICLDGVEEDMISYEELLAGASPDDPGVTVEESDLSCLIHTSGTTGLSKEVMWTHRNWIAGVADVVIKMNVSHHDVVMHVTPAFHIAFAWPMLVALYMGSTQVIVRKFDPQPVLETIERERVSTTLLVPTMIISLVEHPHITRYDRSSLRLIMYGASPMPVNVLEKAISLFGPVFTQVYGLTEQSGAFTCLPREEHILGGTERDRRRLASCGKEMPGCDIRVVDGDGREVMPGEVGEIIARGDNIMKGYWRQPEATAETVRNGWLYTGDLATVDEDGYIYVVDRKKDVIISGGENISSREVEDVLYEHPAVLEAAAIGVPHERWGEAVKAIVVLKKGAVTTEEEIIEHCKRNMAGFKRPQSVEFVDSFPKTPIGKIMKRELREKYWDGYQRRVH